jgi:hypothetical protein
MYVQPKRLWTAFTLIVLSVMQPISPLALSLLLLNNADTINQLPNTSFGWSIVCSILLCLQAASGIFLGWHLMSRD